MSSIKGFFQLPKTLSLVTSLVFSTCTLAEEFPLVYPDDSWQTAKPEQLNVDSNQLQKAMKLLADYSGEDATRETLVIRNGYLIWSGDNTKHWHEIWSATKSFTSTVFGLLVEDGKITENTYAADILPSLKSLYPQLKLKHFATHTSGYNAKGTSRWCENCDQDWSLTPYQPAKPWFEPGTEFLYWDEAMMLFSRALTKVNGAPIKQLFDTRISQPIGMKFDWRTEGEINNIKINNGGGWIFTHAEHLARLAYLYLNQGQWKDKQLIPKTWVAKATTAQVPSHLPEHSARVSPAGGAGVYGYNFWTNGINHHGERSMPDAPAQTYYMSGFNHNVAFIIPEWDMVIVRLGQDGNPPEGKHKVWNQVLGELAKGVKPLPK